VNPRLVRGQLVGGFAQGLGGALLEEFVYGDDGQPAFASFQEYLLPTATEMPRLEVHVTEHAPSPIHPLGVKGAGEGGTVAPAATLANAVSDALGVEVFDLPLSPTRVLDLVDQSRWSRVVRKS
jgi:CO/xanthine dehydrogenase Mo-binding subunit